VTEGMARHSVGEALKDWMKKLESDIWELVLRMALGIFHIKTDKRHIV